MKELVTRRWAIQHGNEQYKRGLLDGRRDIIEYINYVFINSNCITVEDIKPKIKDWLSLA